MALFVIAQGQGYRIDQPAPACATGVGLQFRLASAKRTRVFKGSNAVAVWSAILQSAACASLAHSNPRRRAGER
jgi:hypothetical protein